MTPEIRDIVYLTAGGLAAGLGALLWLAFAEWRRACVERQDRRKRHGH